MSGAGLARRTGSGCVCFRSRRGDRRLCPPDTDYDRAEWFDLPLLGDVREIFPDVGSTALMVIVGVLVAAFFIARAGLLVGQSYLQSRVTENAAADLATRLVTGYLAMPYQFLLRRNSAERSATPTTPSSNTRATRSYRP